MGKDDGRAAAIDLYLGLEGEYMTPMDIVAALSLSLAIALSWQGFRPIFAVSTDEAVLRSPATMLASSIWLGSLGLAFSAGSIGAGGLVVSFGLLLSILLEKLSVRVPPAVLLSFATIFLMSHLFTKAIPLVPPRSNGSNAVKVLGPVAKANTGRHKGEDRAVFLTMRRRETASPIHCSD